MRGCIFMPAAPKGGRIALVAGGQGDMIEQQEGCGSILMRNHWFTTTTERRVDSPCLQYVAYMLTLPGGEILGTAAWGTQLVSGPGCCILRNDRVKG